MIDLNALYKRYAKEPRLVKAELCYQAEKALVEAVSNGYYGREELTQINFPEVCLWLEWPDWQDGGLFEQMIDRAAKFVLELYEL